MRNGERKAIKEDKPAGKNGAKKAAAVALKSDFTKDLSVFAKNFEKGY